jgi:hypothetical protein
VCGIEAVHLVWGQDYEGSNPSALTMTDQLMASAGEHRDKDGLPAVPMLYAGESGRKPVVSGTGNVIENQHCNGS